MSRLGLCGAILAAGLVASCQSLVVGQDDPISIETSVLASNELNTLGRQEIEAGNYGLAEGHFRKAVERNSEDGSSWLGLAAAYDNLGRFELADRAYVQAARVDGETLALLNNRAYSFFLRGDRRRALLEARKARAIAPDHPITGNNLHLIKSGERPNRTGAP